MGSGLGNGIGNVSLGKHIKERKARDYEDKMYKNKI